MCVMLDTITIYIEYNDEGSFQLTLRLHKRQKDKKELFKNKIDFQEKHQDYFSQSLKQQ